MTSSSILLGMCKYSRCDQLDILAELGTSQALLLKMFFDAPPPSGSLVLRTSESSIAIHSASELLYQVRYQQVQDALSVACVPLECFTPEALGVNTGSRSV